MVLDLPDKKRPAPSVQAMERWIHDAQKQTGIAPKRLGWIVATTVVVAALQRALEGDSPLFLVKGGVYLELNLGLRSRATTDVDTMFRGQLSEFSDKLDEALSLPWGPFELIRTEIETIDAPKLIKPRRFWVKLHAKGSVWRKVKIEVSFPEGSMAGRDMPIPVPSVGYFGLQPPEYLMGIAMDYQVAQKLHAASDPDEEGYENQRVHDILDLLLIKDAFYERSTLSLREACSDIFRYRAAEAEELERPVRYWPPVFRINGYWRVAYPPLAETLGIALDVDEAVAAVEAWVKEIDNML